MFVVFDLRKFLFVYSIQSFLRQRYAVEGIINNLEKNPPELKILSQKKGNTVQHTRAVMKSGAPKPPAKIINISLS